MIPLPRYLTVVATLAGAVLVAGCQPQTTAAPAADGAMLVTDVVDGDTFKLVDGRAIRVLGIDSCEASTPGGQAATAQATGLLLNRFVILSAQPGVDLDPYGRQLRYVTLREGGQDFGKAMIPAQHTGLYANGDAGPQQVADLTALDGTPARVCGDEPAPTTTTSSPPPAQVEPDPDVDRPRTYVPAPDPAPRRTRDNDSSSGGSGDSGSAGTKPRSGQSGHPCLPGERDGDDDGYCGEGR